MSLSPRTRIGPYEVLEPVGKGGMGEVFRARDTALGRDVALKFLPRAFAADVDRLARFDREAQALASLNHPNIAQVYAIEQVPAEPGGVPGRAIVMELVEGEDLSARLSRGAIPLDEALPIARQIALALEAAHESGIIHRDLKPANIKIRTDGTAKVLDFGLAKAVGADAGASGSGLANSPTLTAAAFAQGYGPGTEMGVVLGTAAYMSPEQAKGRVVDRRADVWAFGVVLYEMLTGRRAFGGDDVTEVMAAVIRDTPDPAALPAATPPAVRRLIRRCLEKDARKRLRDMGDAGVELEEAMSTTTPDAQATSVVAAPSSPRRSPVVLAGLAIVVAGLAAAAAWLLKPEATVDRPIVRFTLRLDDGQQLSSVTTPNLSWSPDGRLLAYRADGVLFLRNFEDGTTRELLRAPASGQWFSPDGSTLVYRTPSGLSKVAVSGGPSQSVATFTSFLGLAWIDNETIVYSDSKTIVRIPASGGASTPLVTASDGGQVGAPQVLPGGRVLLYTAVSRDDVAVVARGLDGHEPREPKVLLPGVAGAGYMPTGHLVSGRDGRLWAVPFDVDRLEVTGKAAPLPESVYVSPGGFPQAAFSANGSLAYIAAQQTQGLRLSWVDPRGPTRTMIATVPRNYSDLVLSPDGKRAAMHLWDEENDIWVADLVRGGLTRITFSKDEEETPVWSPDGRELAYTGTRDGKRVLMIKAADGSASAVERTAWQNADHFHVNAWSADGTILVETRRSATVNDIVAVDLKTGKSKDLLASAFAEYTARLSPDGKWMAYVSEETSRAEVYVQPYPALNTRVPVSTSGGREPVWSHDGRKLFFRSTENVMEAQVTSASPLEFSAPKAVFRDTYIRTQGTAHTHFDIASDGRFLMIENPNTGTIGGQEILIVLNWFEQLRAIK